MMGNVKIVTDSTCDLPISLVEEFDILVIPCYVNMNGKSYLDGIELSRESFFKSLPSANPLPTTSAPGMDAFIIAYKKLADAGADGIISIHISETLSNINNVAKIAADAFDAVPVRVIDSGQLSMGLGVLALVGAKLAKKGASLDEVEAEILKKKPLTNSFAKLETLEYLRRGGRFSFTMQGIGNLLEIKPITKMSNGISGVEMKRTRKKAHQRFLEIARELGPAEIVGIIHADAYQNALQIRDELKYIWPDVDPIISYVTPAIGAHVGPGTICIVSIQKEIHKPLFESRFTNLRDRVNRFRNNISGMYNNKQED
ncbi:MAG: DegV family protein [Anaerolineaceae bacterium]|nr:DegV family protein [Anaerolineaceae bacterium]